MICGKYGACYYFSHNEITAMTAPLNNSLALLNFAAVISTTAALIHFVATSLLF